MSTRGLFGFKHQEQYYAFYNQSDSYPSGLGRELLQFYFSKVSDQDFLSSLQSIFSKVSSEARDVLYDVTTPYFTAENAVKFLETEAHVVRNDLDFLADSLFCEYAYFLDFTTKELYCFQGFQDKQPEKHSIYDYTPTLKKAFKESCRGYFPCKFVGILPLAEKDYPAAAEALKKLFEEEDLEG